MELITILERRGKYIEHSKIKIAFDNRMQYWKLVESEKKSNICAQEAGVEIAMIKQIIKKIKFEIELKLVKGHKKQIRTYYQNPLKHLHCECDRRVRQAREEISNKMSNMSINFYRSYSIKRKRELQSRSIKEVTRTINARKNEEEYMKRSMDIKIIHRYRS